MSEKENRDTRPGALIVDLDNTLIRDGEQNAQVIDYLKTFTSDYIAIVTARPEAQRENTIADLTGIRYDALIMKPRPSDNTLEFKVAEAEKLQELFNVMIAIDDNANILRAYRDIGITAIHPNEVPTVRHEPIEASAEIDTKLNRNTSPKGEQVKQIETRVNATEFEIREEEDGMTFTGYAAIFDSPSEPLPFIERIQRGAFRKTLRSRNDIKFLWNHDAGEILGSTRAKTLKLYEDERGLRVEGTLPNTTRGRDVAELLRRGDVDSMSFGFSVPSGGDSWSSDGSERTLKFVRLHEVSLVAWPAYTSTAGTVAVRGLAQVAARNNIDASALADALMKVEDGQAITNDEKEMLSRVISDLAPTEEPEAEEQPQKLSALQVKKKKLELLSNGIL